jgi:hypothetical protein
MTVPLLGPLTLSGFANPWWWLFLLVPLALVGLYIRVLLRKRRRFMRFANMELLERVAPRRPQRWRHLLRATDWLIQNTAAGPPGGRGHGPRTSHRPHWVHRPRRRRGRGSNGVGVPSAANGAAATAAAAARPAEADENAKLLIVMSSTLRSGESVIVL